MQRLGLAGHKNASYALLAQLGLLVLHFVLESANENSFHGLFIKRLLLGSETQHVLTHSHIPVLVLR